MLERLVSRKEALASQVKKLRKTVKPLPVDIGPRYYWPPPPPPDGDLFPPFPPFPIDWEKLMEMAIALRELRWRERDFRIIPGPEECKPDSAVLTPERPFGYEPITIPDLGTTASERNFTILETDDYMGVNFEHFYIEDNFDIGLEDGFAVASILKFDFPAQPCDGTYGWAFEGNLRLWPDVTEADWGLIRVWLRKRFHVNGCTDACTDLLGGSYRHITLPRGIDSYRPPLTTAIRVDPVWRRWWEVLPINSGEKASEWFGYEAKTADSEIKLLEYIMPDITRKWKMELENIRVKFERAIQSLDKIAEKVKKGEVTSISEIYEREPEEGFTPPKFFEEKQEEEALNLASSFLDILDAAQNLEDLIQRVEREATRTLTLRRLVKIELESK